MPFSSGPNTVNDSIVFNFDIGDTTNSYKGEPTTNICSGTPYSIYNSGATNIRNSTDITPPVPGYEVVKVTADNIGTYGQCILWRADYATSPVFTITNSVYAYLTAGSYVQVGQHWFPWNYGSPKYITKNQWVRISETYGVNDGGSYGTAAMVYSTDGIAYFSMPQYEIKPQMTSFVNFNGTRSTTQGLLDISGVGNTVDLVNMTYGANNAISFDGTDDYMNLSTNIQSGFTSATYEFVCRPTSLPGGGNYFQLYIQENSTWIALYNVGAGAFFGIDLGNGSGWFDNNGGNTTGARTFATLSANTWYHVVYSWNGNTVSVYLNGSLQSTVSTNQAANGRQNVNTLGPGNTPRNIGSRGGGNYWIGQIPIVKFYNKALLASEIQNNYLAYKTRFNLS